MTSIGRICIYVYISSNTRIYSISPEGFIQACVSATLLQGGGVEQIKYIYITLLQGGVEQKKKNIYIFLLDPPQLPVRRKCAGCGQWGLDRCQCQVKKNGTPGDKYRGHLGEK